MPGGDASDTDAPEHERAQALLGLTHVRAAGESFWVQHGTGFFIGEAVGMALMRMPTGVVPTRRATQNRRTLYLAAAVDLDQETGEFVLDAKGNVTLQEGGILVRWEEVEHLEFIDA